MKRIGVVAVSLVLGAQSCLAVLKPGDPAPDLQVGEWLQGEAVTEFEGDKVYIVEFWATWCGPCIASIPHINDLHQRLEEKGLVVIGQNVFERDDSLVQPFLNKMADKMTYRVTSDDKSDGGRGQMAQTWLAAAEKNGIPCAFVINKSGEIVSIQHPASIKEADLEALLAEPSTGAAAAPAPRPEDNASAPSAEAQALALRAKAEIQAGEWDKAEASVGELQGILPEKFRDIGGLLYIDLLLARKQNSDALMLTRMMADDFKDTPSVLISIATRIAGQSGDAKLLKEAEKIATPISATAGKQQVAALATLARIAFVKGDQVRAVELQSKAVEQAPEGKPEGLKATLEAYKAGRLPE